MKTVKTRGLIIRSIDYRDSSKIVYVLTPLGILSIRALGTKRYKNKNYNFSEKLTLVEMEISDSSFPVIYDYNILDRFDEIKSDIDKYFKYSYMLEFLTKLPLDINYERVLDFTLSIIKLGKIYEPLTLIVMLQIKFLPLFGIKPEFNVCMICQKPNPLFISIPHGGGLCNNCRDAESYLIDEIKLLYDFNIKSDNLSKLDNINIKLLLEFINKYYLYHEYFSLKSYKTIISLIK